MEVAYNVPMLHQPAGSFRKLEPSTRLRCFGILLGVLLRVVGYFGFY